MRTPGIFAVAASLMLVIGAPGCAPVGTQATATSSSPPSPAQRAVELRTRLEELLGQHVVLSVEMMRGRLRQRPDFAQAVFDAAARNSSDFRSLIASVYGPGPAQQFEVVWDSHLTSLFDYARAIASKDDNAKMAARQTLTSYPNEIGTLLQSITAGNVNAPTVAAVEARHVNQMIGEIDAYARGNYAEAYSIERDGYRLEFSIGKLIAAQVASQGGGKLPEAFDSPEQRLQSALGMLFGEHLYLATDVMRAAYDGAPEFQAAAAALDANSRELSSAFGALFGPSTGQRFLELWAGHIDGLVEYSSATAAKNSGQASAAQARLREFEQQFTAFLATSTEGKLAAPELRDGIVEHDRQLMAQLDAFGIGNYAEARDVSFEAYQHMFDLAGKIAQAVGATVAARLPRGGPQTGLGGLAWHRP